MEEFRIILRLCGKTFDDFQVKYCHAFDHFKAAQSITEACYLRLISPPTGSRSWHLRQGKMLRNASMIVLNRNTPCRYQV